MEEIIRQIKELQNIKPDENWVVSAKQRILKEKKPFFLFKPLALRGLAVSCLLIGIVIIAQNALPGDLLYSVKKVSEKPETFFVSNQELPIIQLEITNKRLEELREIAKSNQVKKIAPALKEYQASISKVAENLKSVTSSELKKEIIEETKKLAQNRKEIESFGVVFKEFTATQDPIVQIVEQEINELENKSLTLEQQEILEEIKIDFENKDYSEALEKILILSYPQEK